MNRYTLALFAFFLATLPVVGQERLTLSERPSTQSLETAKQLIKSAETAATKLAVAGYALIDIKLTGKLTNYVVPGSDDCLTTVAIPKGTVFQGWFYVGTELTWVKITAADVDRLLVTGTKKGTATIIWMTVKDNEAVVVAAFQFDVAGGKPKPGPDDAPPVDDPFTKALRAELGKDRVKGLADNKYLDALSGIYEAASRDTLESLKTAGELDAMLNSARVAAGIPEAAKMLPSLREWLRGQMVAVIGGTPETQLTPDKRQAAKVLFAKIAGALEAISK